MKAQPLEVGPFTPQELDTICAKLKASAISFLILKDEETEKIELRDDYANLTNKAEFRTENYLGQIFYLQIAQTDFDKHKKMFSDLGMATTHKENPEELVADMSDVHQETLKQNELKRVAAWALVILAISVLLSVFGVFSRF
jgi:hypothetical protein